MALEICPNCSKALVREVERCPRCGHPIRYAQKPQRLNERPKWEKKSRDFRPIRAGVLLIAAGIVIYGLLGLRDPSQAHIGTFIILVVGLVVFFLGLGIQK